MGDEAELRRAAQAGDEQAMAALAGHLEAQARRLDSEAREWLRRGMDAGSLEAAHGLVRLAVAEREYGEATMLLRFIKARFADVAPERLISVAPDVLGRGLPLDGDAGGDGSGVFTIVTPSGGLAAAALAPVVERLLDVDEHGEIQAELPDGVEPPYTPNYLAPLERCHFAVQVTLDTKGMMWSAMGRTMVGILVEGLAAAALPAHIAGDCLDLRGELHEF